MPRGISRYDEAAFQGRLWTPKDSGVSIALWLDASDLSTISYGTSGISEWRDKSGNNRHATQGTDANRPTLTAIGLNSRPVISFDGSNDSFDFTGSHGQEWSAFIVGRANGTQQVFYQFGGINIAGNLQIDTGVGGYAARAGTVGGGSLGLAPCTLGENVLLSCDYSNSGSYVNLYKNGTLGTPGSGTAPAASALASTIGQFGSIWYLNGFIAEFIVIDSINSAIRQKAEGYLAWKWGLQNNLISSHAFINRPPTTGD
jgi:hypothetical protein